MEVCLGNSELLLHPILLTSTVISPLLIQRGAMPLSKREPILLVSIALQHVWSRGGTRDSLSRLPPMRFLLLLLNHPALVRGNLCVGRIGNPIIIIFLALIYSSTMRGVVNHTDFAPPALRRD
jgi:hypothetical protein